jgi:DNA-binding response OmpR family regulator
MKFRFRFETVVEFILHTIDFEARFVVAKPFEETQGFYFELVSSIHHNKKPYKIVPEKSDNCTVNFFLRNLPNFKKVVSISPKQINFQGSLKHLKNYFGSTIYDIELKLPLKRLKVSGIFQQKDQYNYYFENYAFSDQTKQALFTYAEDNFAVRNKIFVKQKQNAEIKPKTTRTKKVIPKLQIFIIDDKKGITDIVHKILKDKTDFEIKTYNSVEGLTRHIEDFSPNLILLDYEMPNLNVKDCIQEIHKTSSALPVILTTFKKRFSSTQQIQELGAVGVLQKPISSNELIRKIKMAIRQSLQKKSFKPDLNTIVFATQNDDFAKDALKTLKDFTKQVFDVSLQEQIIPISEKKQATSIFIYFPDKNTKLLSLINTIRRNGNLSKTAIFVISDNESDVDLIEALDDPRIFSLSEITNGNDLKTVLQSFLDH